MQLFITEKYKKLKKWKKKRRKKKNHTLMLSFSEPKKRIREEKIKGWRIEGEREQKERWRFGRKREEATKKERRR